MWEKANIKEPKGRGKLEAVPTKGDKGIPPGSSVPKQSWAKGGKVIDAPQLKGNRGITTQSGFKSTKAPRD